MTSGRINGATHGDPVNLATGEEEYTPDTDLTVYNPLGPSVSWTRIYGSLRVPYEEPWYEYQDFGNGWSQGYNLGVNDPTNGGSGPSNDKFIFMPNGGRILFTAPNVPTSAAPVVKCQVQPGFAYLVSWNYNSANGTTYYDITDSNRTQYVTSTLVSTTLCAVLSEIIDRNGNAIHFNYSAPLPEPGSPNASWPLLTSITDVNGSPLLVINRVQDGTGAVASVDDRYGRTVYYHIGYYAATAITFSPNIYACDHVSQIEPTDTANPPDRYHYGYTLTANNDGYQLPKLATISVPNPTGSTVPATATIAYDPTYATVSSITDANGNETSFESVDQLGNPAWGTNYEEAIVTGPNMPQAYKFTVSFNSSMAQLTGTDGIGNKVRNDVYGDANNPYSPTLESDGNGNVTTNTYTPEGVGDIASTVSPRGMTFTYTWNYANFGLGEATEEQDSYTNGGVATYKAPISVTYYEPSGLPHAITKPMPGTVNSSTEVTYQFSYDSLGDVIQAMAPGNNSTTTNTISLGYGSTPQRGQPLTAVDNLGHTMTFTYDIQGNRTSLTDALGNTVYWGNTSGIYGYNIANQNVLVTYPATDETGSGSSGESTTYQYPGGPITSTQAFNESGTQIRQIANTYGSEGELLTISGSTEFASYAYDALYRIYSLTDANAHITNYYYNEQGYLDSVTYPGYSGPTPAYSSSLGTWSNVTGPDSMRNASYDADGDILKRIDGRGVTTTYVYNDPESMLTGISYNVIGTSVPSQQSVSLTYDGFGRISSINNGVTQTLYGYTSGSTLHPGYDDNDSALNVQTSFYNGGSIAFSKSISYTYYSDGSRASILSPSGTFSYAYDAAGRPTSVTNPFSETTFFSYLNNNRISGETLSDGGTSAYTYNAKGLMTDLKNKDGSGTILSDFSGMTYDGVGNRTALVVNVPSDTAYSGDTSYTLDSKDELAAEASTRGGGYTNTFAYDGAENPTTFRSSPGKTYNGDNQSSSSSYAYDGDGNPTTYGGSSFVFDAENRLISVGSALTAGYDATNMRAWKTDSIGTTFYLYADNSTSPICELNSSGTVTATNTYTLNGLVSRNSAAGSTFYEFDEQGSVAERLNSSGACTSSSMADAFGAVANSASISDPFGYIGQFGYYTDAVTGLILTTFRYYDCTSGRFLNRDPSGYQGGIDLYNYVQNNAANLNDPTGYKWSYAPSDPVGCVIATLTCSLVYAGCSTVIMCVPTILVCLISWSATCAPDCPPPGWHQGHTGVK
jgi:RHS repeat-associated protein